MRLLLSATPTPGNLVPLLTVGRAAQRAGHDVAVLAPEDVLPLVAPLDALTSGPTFAELRAEAATHGAPDLRTAAASPAVVAANFATARLRLGADDALQAAARWRPDLVVAEVSDSLGPLVAAARRRPWYRHAFGVPLPTEFLTALEDAAGPFFTARGLRAAPPAAALDPWPDSLRGDVPVDPDRIPITLDRLRTTGGAASLQLPDESYVLVTFGTQVTEEAALVACVESLLRETGFPVVVTRGALHSLAFDDPRVTVVDFVGLGDLLDRATLTVTVGGSGTVLASLSAAVPVVVLPFFPSQHWVADRLRAAGVGEVVGDASETGAAVSRLADSDAAAARTRAVAHEIAALGRPEAVVERLAAIAAT